MGHVTCSDCACFSCLLLPGRGSWHVAFVTGCRGRCRYERRHICNTGRGLLLFHFLLPAATVICHHLFRGKDQRGCLAHIIHRLRLYMIISGCLAGLRRYSWLRGSRVRCCGYRRLQSSFSACRWCVCLLARGESICRFCEERVPALFTKFSIITIWCIT